MPDLSRDDVLFLLAALDVADMEGYVSWYSTTWGAIGGVHASPPSLDANDRSVLLTQDLHDGLVERLIEHVRSLDA